MSVMEKILEFFGVKLPTEVIKNETEIIEFFDNSKVREILPESDPQLYVDKAVILNSAEGRFILATVPVSDKMCQGHFNWFPMMPLALLGQATAQVGALLISLVSNNGEKKKIPLVVRVKDIKSISDKRNKERKDFIVPGDTMLVAVNYLGGKFGFHKTSAAIYVGESKMGIMEEIDYVLVDKEYFNNGR